jgi:hypothetical protein
MSDDPEESVYQKQVARPKERSRKRRWDRKNVMAGEKANECLP